LQRALSCLDRGALADCIAYAERASALVPDNGFARMVLGVALASAGKRDAALPVLEHATRLSPGDAQVHYNFAVTLQEAGHTLRAMTEYRHCLECDPDFRDALWNYGELLRLDEHFAHALSYFDRLAAIEGTMRPMAAHRMAVCCAYLGLDDRADTLFREQIGQNDDPSTHWEYALFLLKQRRFDEAWPHYARRFDAGEQIMVRGARLPCPYPRWSGQFQPGAVLIVTGEQGAGDEILFATFVPALLALAKPIGMRVVLACRAELVRLFRASFPDAHVESSASMESRVDATIVANARIVWHAPIGDLPLWIAKPPSGAYLKPDAADVTAAREWIGSRECARPRTGKGRPLRVGLVWSANPASTRSNRVSRNVPSVLLNGWFAGLDGVQFYSLMPAAHADRLTEAPDLPLVDLSRFVTDFSRTAAAMQCMDAVVSVCTSSANLAGAVGVDLHVLLQHHADWRWAGDGVAWFARVARYQQPRPGDWSPCLAQLVRTLQPGGNPRPFADDAAIARQAALEAGRTPSPVRATPVHADDAQTWFKRGIAQRAQGADDQAIASFRRSLAIRPDAPVVLNELGLALAALGRASDATSCYRKAIELDSAAANPHYNLALLLRNDAPAQAEAAFRQAVMLDPAFSFAWNGLGLLLHDQRRFDEAESCYRRALASGPDNLPAHVNYGLTLLMLGRYREAWPLYEVRHEDRALAANDATAVLRPPLDFPRWRGEPLDGRSLLVWPEQGLGDIIQFIRFVPMLRDLGAARVTVACWPALEALLKESIDGVDWLRLAAGMPIPRHDAWCFLTSLPSFLNTTLDTLPGPFPYLRAPAQRIDRARLPDAPLRVGLVWGSGRSGAFAENGRSVPLSACQPFLDIDGLTFVSLQMGDAREELSGLPARLRPVDVMTNVQDMADTAALMAGLDLVITVDTSVAHLAGALGRPVWMLLRHAACWRWLDRRDDSPWYPGARLFRQPAPGDWASAVEQVRGALSTWASHAGAAR